MRQGANYIVSVSPRLRLLLLLLTLYIDVRDAALLTSMSTRRRTNDRLGNDSTAKTAASNGPRSEFITAARVPHDGHLIEITLYLLLYSRIGFLQIRHVLCIYPDVIGHARTAHQGIAMKNCFFFAGYENIYSPYDDRKVNEMIQQK